MNLVNKDSLTRQLTEYSKWVSSMCTMYSSYFQFNSFKCSSIESLNHRLTVTGHRVQRWIPNNSGEWIVSDLPLGLVSAWLNDHYQYHDYRVNVIVTQSWAIHDITQFIDGLNQVNEWMTELNLKD